MCLFTSVDLFSHYLAITLLVCEETVVRESTGVSGSDIHLASLLFLPVECGSDHSFFCRPVSQLKRGLAYVIQPCIAVTKHLGKSHIPYMGKGLALVSRMGHRSGQF